MNINGRMKVKTLRAEFKEEFGLILRIYDGRSFADDNSTLASIRKGDNKGGDFSPRKSTKVGNLEDKIMDKFGIKVQISGSDDSYLCNNDLTLAKALDKDDKKIARKSNKVMSGSANLNTYKDGDEDLDGMAEGLTEGEDSDYWVDELLNKYENGKEVAKDMLRKAVIQATTAEDIGCLIDIAKSAINQLDDKALAEYAIEESVYFLRPGVYCSIYFAYRDILKDHDAATAFLNNNKSEMIDDNEEYECELEDELNSQTNTTNNNEQKEGVITSKLIELLNELPEDEKHSTLESLLTAIDEDEIGGGIFFEAQNEVYANFDDIFHYARKKYSLDREGLLSTLSELFSWYEKYNVSYDEDEIELTDPQELIDEIEQYF